MAKLTATTGISGSGKSYWAEEQVRKSPGRIKRVEKDLLRQMVHAGEWSHALEKDIIIARDALIVELLLEGYDVIVSDTNFGKHLKDLETLAKDVGVGFVVKDFTQIDLWECIKRDSLRSAEKQIGRKVIMEQYNKYVRPNLPPIQEPKYDPRKRDCVICDIDGTVAKYGCGPNKRGPYEWARVGEDAPRKEIINIVKRLIAPQGTKWDAQYEQQVPYNLELLFVSGRMEDCRAETHSWLWEQNFTDFMLYMRASKDMRRDSIVKREIYDRHIEPHYNVIAVVDDREQVLRECWRPLGLPVLAVGDGIEF